MKTIAEFNEIIKTQEFVDFQFKFMPLQEVENGQFFFFNGSFFQASGEQNMKLRLAKKASTYAEETNVIPNSYKVSAIINF